jgi:hypothetical protein
MKNTFVIDTEFRAYLPPQRQEENDALRIKLQLEGCKLGALTVANILGEHILIDGHHTNDICQAEGIETSEPVVINLPNRDEAKAWMRQNQLARRNLTDEQRTYYLGEEFNSRKHSHGGDRKGGGSIRQNDGLIASTAEQLAEEHGISPRTVERAGKFADAVNSIGEQNPVVKDAILGGATDVKKAEVVAAADPNRLFCDACRAGAPRRGCRQCRLRRRRSASQRKKAKKGKPRTLKQAANAEADGELKDELDNSVPPGLRPVFEDAAILRGVLSQFREIKAILNKLYGRPAVLHLHKQEIEMALDNARQSIRYGMPYVVCPVCSGSGKDRKADCPCKGSGWLPEDNYKVLPQEYRQ